MTNTKRKSSCVRTDIPETREDVRMLAGCAIYHNTKAIKRQSCSEFCDVVNPHVCRPLSLEIIAETESVLFFVPCAFFATLTRNNNTMMLKTWDMSPARRKMFMLIAPQIANKGATRQVMGNAAMEYWWPVTLNDSTTRAKYRCCVRDSWVLLSTVHGQIWSLDKSKSFSIPWAQAQHTVRSTIYSPIIIVSKIHMHTAGGRSSYTYTGI